MIKCHYAEKLLYVLSTTVTLLAFITGAGLTRTLSPVTPPLRSGINSYRFVADTDNISALMVNPAGLAARSSLSTIIRGNYTCDRLDELSLALGGGGFGLGYSRQDRNSFKSDTYMMGLAFSSGPAFNLGTSLRWHTTDLEENSSPFALDLGFLARPGRWLSLGGVWRNANTPRFMKDRLADTFTGGLSIRPLTEHFTISAQGTFAEGRSPSWRGGGRLSILRGVEIFGSYTEDLSWMGDQTYREFSAGIAFTLDNLTARTSTRSRSDWNSDYSGYSLSMEGSGAYIRNSIFHPEKFAEVNISGRYLDEGGGFVLMGDDGKNLQSILKQLKSIRDDRDIKGVLLNVGTLEGGFIGPVSANLYEIRHALEQVAGKGKPVVAYLENGGSASEFYLASAADRIVAPGKSTIGMIGVSLEILRLKNMFAKLGVDWDHTTTGDYKSTFHTYYTDTTTAVQEEELRSLVEESYRLMVEAIAGGREMSYREMSDLADGRIFRTTEALEAGLIDRIGWERDARKLLAELSGEPSGDINTVSVAGRSYREKRWAPPPVVAVVGAYGSIRPGRSRRDMLRGGRTMGSETVVKQLRAASAHPAVRAMVLRVDSGGGSVLASDAILNQIERIRSEKGIPVIISMSNMAASGGYWISMSCDAIFADPFTITGSIGVVFSKPVLEELFRKTGINHEVFKMGEHSDAMSMGRKFTPEESSMLDHYIDGLYESFIHKVSEGRGMEPERVREIAGGRIYFGTRALELNLIDRLGGLKDAVDYAASSAGIGDDYRRIYFSAFPRGFLERFSPAGVFSGLKQHIHIPGLTGRKQLDEVIEVF